MGAPALAGLERLGEERTSRSDFGIEAGDGATGMTAQSAGNGTAQHSESVNDFDNSPFEHCDAAFFANATSTGHSPGRTSSKNTVNSTSESPDLASGTERARKRQRNTEAARRYRQRKVDRVTELEEALAGVSKERDELRLRLARAEAEAEVLRGMMRKT